MIKQIRNSKVSKVVAAYLAIMMFLQVTQPMQAYALTSGPTQPEFNSFTPIGTSDMVDLTSGDFSYNIPVMDVGGYPINLSYNSNVTMDQEASWVGLGWNLNVGQVKRQVRGLPDDFKGGANGDALTYEDFLRESVTIGTNFNLSPSIFGGELPIKLNFGLGAKYNNYDGMSFNTAIGATYEVSKNVQVGMNLTGSDTEGTSVNPSVSISGKKAISDLSVSAGFNSRRGFESISASASTGSHPSMDASLSFGTNSYTPTQRVTFHNFNNTFNGTFGIEIYGVETDMRTTGFGTYQRIHPHFENRNVWGYGYDYSHHKNTNVGGVMDFNRENEQTFNKFTAALPVTNHTYDIYSINGQGIAGTVRPHRGQVSVVYNDLVVDNSGSSSFGGEFGAGSIFHAGMDFEGTKSTTTTGPWINGNNTIPYFAESNQEINNALFEPVVFKTMGELNVDQDKAFHNQMLGDNPMSLALGGGYWRRRLNPMYQLKQYPQSIAAPTYSHNHLPGRIKRTERLNRNQSVQKVTVAEVDNNNEGDKSTDQPFFTINTSYAKPHHTAGFKVLKPDGSTYIFGKAIYNTKKVEATFDVSGRIQTATEKTNNTINYNGSSNGRKSSDGGNGSDDSNHYLNKITTPAYAHSYLITDILSQDYEDINGNGTDDGDLGSYTKFNYYPAISNYKWRTPYAHNEVSYNAGVISSKRDQTGSYLYGEKEMVYIKTIETKTHIAFFELEDRTDAMSVASESGGIGSTATKSLKSIRLYSKSELSAGENVTTNLLQSLSIQSILDSEVKPIKTAHFEYSKSLCSQASGSTVTTKGSGKLTLVKVYFTYRGSNMGKYTPYVFDYGSGSVDNPSYELRGSDVWGYYKKNKTGTDELSNIDFPFVEQNENKANENAQAWVLKKISLPSGGVISVEVESDDYQFVQNRKAMQMFKVKGAGTSANVDPNNNELYSGRTHNNYLYVDLGPEGASLRKEDFKKRYLKENQYKPIYYKFLVNMTQNPNHYDYVEGYFLLDNSKLNDNNDFISDGSGMASIPVTFVNKGRISGNANPIAKSGWGYARTHLSRMAFNGNDNEVVKDFGAMVKSMVSALPNVSAIFKGPNRVLEGNGCAQKFNNNKSWIRLENPNGRKLGGGLRVQKIELSDRWDIMTGNNGSDLYEEYYGQEYEYTLEGDDVPEADRTSSGVATFEPNRSPDNPFIEPVYGDEPGFLERMASPKERNYIERPFGSSFFPGASVTYSLVKVKNLSKDDDNEGKKIRKHATGHVITEHYTSKDFPTKSDFTKMFKKDDSPRLAFLIKSTRKHLTATQGFSVVTNDMNGKVKSTKVYQEGADEPISRVEYKYSLDENNDLNNHLTTIDATGKIEKNYLGVDTDVINDINESKSNTISTGTDTNLAMFMAAVFPCFIPVPIPEFTSHETQLRTATTTKVVHKTGILVETIAYDLGSKVSTKNLAWDYKTGQVLLTQTVNEFDDNYYSFTYPAYWAHENMGLASDNIGATGYIFNTPGKEGEYTILGLSTEDDISNYFKKGDEIDVMNYSLTQAWTVVQNRKKLWVSDYVGDGKGVKLMDKDGNSFEEILNYTWLNNNIFKVQRSGNRNVQSTSMATVTSTINPIDKDNNGVKEPITNTTFAYSKGASNPLQVINASAVEFSNVWNGVCEGGIDFKNETYNPFLHNVRGDWRAIRSYAYLSGRVSDRSATAVNRRNAGYFVDFQPFYQLSGENWVVNAAKWTTASTVTKFSPYGPELENKDALGRHSSAQYGYKYTLPTAVTSNAKYEEMGFDGFEDASTKSSNDHFGFSQTQVDEEQGVSITDETSHTGKKSIKIEPGATAQFKRKIDGCRYDPIIVE